MAVQKSSGKISRKAAKLKRGQRYPKIYRAEVMKWIRTNPGRGAIGNAAEKFKVSDSTLRNWLREESAPVEVKTPRAKRKKMGRPAGSLKDALKDKVEKLAQEATATNIHLHELLRKLGWPDL